MAELLDGATVGADLVTTVKGQPATSMTHRRASDAYTARLAELIADYEGDPVEVSFRALAGPLTVDESAQALHPYPARLLRHIPRFLMGCQQLVAPGELVLDPFCGSGTVLTEAMRWGLSAWGVDVNPLAVLISRVKTSDIDLTQCESAARSVASLARASRRPLEQVAAGLEYWFGAETARGLQHLIKAVDTVSSNETNEFLLLCLSLTVDNSAHKDRRIPVPVRPRGTELPRGERTAVFALFEALASETLRRLSVLKAERPTQRSWVEIADARSLLSGPPEAPSLVLTSPPYGAAQKYARSSAHSLKWLRLVDPDRFSRLEHQMVGREHIEKNLVARPSHLSNQTVLKALASIRTVNPYRAAIYSAYFEDMASTFSAIASRAPSATLVFVASDNTVAGMQLPTHDLLASIAGDVGYSNEVVLRDRIVSRSMTTKRAHTAGIPIHHEYIHIMTRGRHG